MLQMLKLSIIDQKIEKELKEKNDEDLYTPFAFKGLQRYINRGSIQKALNSKRGKNY